MQSQKESYKFMLWTYDMLWLTLKSIFKNKRWYCWLIPSKCVEETGKMEIPRRGSETFISTIGHIDGRINLDPRDVFVVENEEVSVLEQRGIQLEAGNRSLMDVSMMASKLAYENATVIKNVVNLHWKACFLILLFLVYNKNALTFNRFCHMLLTDAFCWLLQLLEWYMITCNIYILNWTLSHW